MNPETKPSNCCLLQFPEPAPLLCTIHHCFLCALPALPPRNIQRHRVQALEAHTCLSTHPEAAWAEFSGIWSLGEECIQQTRHRQGPREVLPELSVKVDRLERKITNIPQQLSSWSISKKGFTSGKKLPAGNWVC